MIAKQKPTPEASVGFSFSDTVPGLYRCALIQSHAS
jgi:hypothetical protein